MDAEHTFILLECAWHDHAAFAHVIDTGHSLFLWWVCNKVLFHFSRHIICHGLYANDVRSTSGDVIDATCRHTLFLVFFAHSVRGALGCDGCEVFLLNRDAGAIAAVVRVCPLELLWVCASGGTAMAGEIWGV